MGGQVEAAELQKLAVMAETTKVASFCQNGHRVDRTDAGKLAKPPIVCVVGKCGVGLLLDRIALPDQVAPLGDHHPEHCDCCAIHRHRQSNRTSCCLVDIAQQ